MARMSCRDGKWIKQTLLRYYKLDEDGSGGDFETSYAKTDTPAKYLDSDMWPSEVRSGIIRRIHYRLNPTNAVTYTLRLYRGAKDDDYASNLHMIYESPSAQADDQDYDRCELYISVAMLTAGRIYYAIEWSGAPSTTCGFIEVSGESI